MVLWGYPFSFWETVFRWAMVISLVAGGITAIALFASGWLGYSLTDIAQKDADTRIAAARKDTAAALERIAELNKETARLSADAESSRATVAEANARAAEAQLALEKLKTPRTLGHDRQQFVIAAAKPFRGQRYRAAISQGADDGLAFWESLYVTLEKAGWIYLPAGGPSIGSPPAGTPIAAIPGVEIQFDPAKESELAPAALALGKALHADGMVVAVNRDTQLHMNEAEQNDLLIVIGARVPPP
jgi:hypothetical protein